MSEKRYYIFLDDVLCIRDRTNKRNTYKVGKNKGFALMLCDLLNEQQTTINELKERNAHNFAKKIELMKENEQLRQQNEEYKRSIDFMIEKSAEISNRNVLLRQEMGEITRKLKEKEEDGNDD